MSKFGGSNNKKEVPAMTSSSLSDIVFMLLFFFMVTTQMRETENKVMVKIPEASEVVKLERKDLNSYINIGTPIKSLQAMYGTEARIQLNDSFKTTDDIRDFVAAERESKSEADRQFMTISIRADQDVRMGIITDVKQELRRCSALKIMYSARKAGK
ncbi:MAG: biopolymer transporter ExbD [Bacteroidales bacterium]|nr:biopolymer transporter ExbD [Bacteroidales bacterium]